MLSVKYAMLDAFTAFAHVYYYPLIVLMALAGFLFFRHKKIFLAALLLSTVAAQAAKPLYGEPRPCAGAPDCPQSHGFPSVHSAAAGAFALASLGTPAFFAAAPFSLLVAYSRVHGEVHSFEQVFAGYALGLAVYAALWAFLHKHAAHELVSRYKLLE